MQTTTTSPWSRILICSARLSEAFWESLPEAKHKGANKTTVIKLDVILDLLALNIINIH
jgi:hypothetical protein